MTPYPLDRARDAFVQEYELLGDLLAGLTDEQLLLPSRCHGWAVCDVVCHLHLGLQELLCGFSVPAGRPADTGFATYWRHEQPGGSPPLTYTRFVRLVAGAYSRPGRLVTHLRPTLDAVLAQTRRAAPDDVWSFQGCAIPAADLIATWVVEAAVHHLDVTLHLPAAPPPAAPALAVVRETAEALGLPPMPWDDVTLALRATGREPLDDADRVLLGPAAALVPVLG
ncbi:MAG TPA: maleylpyruvate isomerase N-terminal domain-containing protein [Pseudonocardiaceae bacterium]